MNIVGRMEWTPELDARLKSLWGSGLTAQQVCDEMGLVSRSAVIGRLHRLNVPRRGAAVPAPRLPRPPRPLRQPRPSRPSRAVEALEPTPLLRPERIEDQAIPLDQRKSLLELTATSCRWPVGDPGTPEFFFCGGDREHEHSPYCAGHAAVAFTAAGRLRPVDWNGPRRNRAAAWD